MQFACECIGHDNNGVKYVCLPSLITIDGIFQLILLNVSWIYFFKYSILLPQICVFIHIFVLSCIFLFLQTKEMEEKKEQIKILDEIITEYHREFSK